MARLHGQLDELDATVFEALGDAATLDGRPVQGMFESFAGRLDRSAQFGKLRTGLTEPRFILQGADLQAATIGSVLVVDLPAPDGGRYEVVDIEPSENAELALVLRLFADD